MLPGLELRRPIPIVVEESADDVVARWIEPAITGLGRSEGEAIESLAEVIVDLGCAPTATGSPATRGGCLIIEAYVAPAGLHDAVAQIGWY